MKNIPDIYKRLELQIGFTDICDLACKMCIQTSDTLGIYGEEDHKLPPFHSNNKGFMGQKVFDSFIYSMSHTKLHFRFILLHWLGESLLHPRFSDFLKVLISENNKYVFFDTLMLFTNAISLRDDLAQNIHSCMKKTSKDLYIVFSLDAFSSKTFLTIKGKDLYDLIINNIYEFIDKFDLPNIKYIFRFLVMPENYLEAKDFLDHWNSFCMAKFDYKPLITFNEEKPRDFDAKAIINFRRVASSKQIEMEELHKKTLVKLGIISDTKDRILDFGDKIYDSAEREPCSAPFRTPILHWDGSITACCADSELELKMGNILKENFDDIFLGNSFEILRKAHLLKKRLPPRCNRCGNLMGLGLSKKEILELSS